MEDEREDSGDIRFITLLDVGLQLAQDQRESFLNQACSTDPELLAALNEQIAWEERMGDFLLQPLIRSPLADQPFRAGDLAAGRFRIVREVGRGGMGVIYEAVDERLGQRRALKCARPGFQQRLPPEARAAMRVTHDNICRVYEIHTAETEQGPIDILCMEFVEGETLATRILGRGLLPPSEALHVLRQLCLGLAAAHKQKLLHRDLKSNNVMLSVDGRAVIMDFGLARDTAGDSEFRLSSELRGAPPYIAPELWKGATASVASDLYALGSIAYEMVTGVHPFTGASMEHRLTQAPLAPSSLTTSLAPMWDRVILRCLHPDPAQRFFSAEQLLEDLAPRKSRHTWLWAAGLTIAALVTVYAIRPKVPAVLPVGRIALLPVRATGCEKAPIQGVVYDVSDRLRKIQGLVSIPFSETLAKGVADAGQAQSKLGATHVYDIGVNCKADAFEVQASIVDAKTKVVQRKLSSTYSNSSLSNMSTALVGVVTAAFKLKPADVPEQVGAVAYPYYAQAVYLNRHEKRSWDQATLLFQHAAELDPKSILPLTGLTEVYLSRYRDTKDRQWLEKARQTLHEVESRNPDSAAFHLEAGGISRADLAWDQAAESYRRVLQLEPWNGDAWDQLAITYGAMKGRQAEAAQAFTKAIELQPGYFEPYVDFGIFYFRQGDYSQAEIQFRSATNLAPGDVQSHSNLCAVYTLMGKYGDAEASCRHALALNPSGGGYNNLGAILAFEGRDSEALTEYRKAIHLEPQKYVYFQNTGDALRRLNLTSQARSDYQTGKDLATAWLRDNPSSAASRSFVGYFAIRLGDLQTGRNEIEQALHLAPESTAVLRNAILAYEAIHQRDRVLALLRTAPSLINELNRHPDLKALSQDPAFIELLHK